MTDMIARTLPKRMSLCRAAPGTCRASAATASPKALTSRPPVADNKPANHKLIDLHATDPRPSDHQPSDSESANRNCPQGHSAERQSADREGSDPGRSHGGISYDGRASSCSVSLNLMTSSAIIHHRPALLEVLQAGSGGGCPRLSARQEP